jgi:Xaa-Pro aminopeptidase
MPNLNLDFPRNEYLNRQIKVRAANRQIKVRAAMEKEGIELLMVHLPVNINYLTGSRAKGCARCCSLRLKKDRSPS